MTASTLVTVFCDAPSCGQWEDAGVGATASDARRGLRGRWRVGVRNPEGGKSLDYCPEHAVLSDDAADTDSEAGQ